VRSVAFLLIVTGVAVPGPAWAQTPFVVDGAETEMTQGDVVEDDTLLQPLTPGMGLVFQSSIRLATSRSRLHFSVESSAGPTWALSVTDENGRIVSTFSGLEGENEYWTEAISGFTANIKVFTIAAKETVVIRLDKIARSSPPIVKQAINPPDEREKMIDQGDDLRFLGRSVVLIRYINDRLKQATCTGFLISADLVLTNNHCLSKNIEVKSALFDFDFDVEGSVQLSLRAKKLLVTSVPLDFSVLRLSAATDRRPLRLAQTTNLNPPMPLVLIQHPGGEPKQVSIKGCRLVQTLVEGVRGSRADFSHSCDTLGGSSGSPVFSIMLDEVIGLHHLGFESGSKFLKNQAVQIGDILEFLKTNDRAVFDEIAARPQ